jgi:UDP-2,3-diacylglucosamine pyrophosphatase LpxH
MLAVISDLHFEEEKSDVIPGGPEPIGRQRNVLARAFVRVLRDLAELVEHNNAARLDVVLAGDIFDMHRTTLWFQGNPRPYVSNATVDGACEQTILRILDAIAEEPEVKKTLELLKLLGQGKYRDNMDDPASTRPFGVPVEVHYIPGNHDRLLNSTRTIRSRVRSLLGMTPGEDRFRNSIPFTDPRVLVRHGHEYDRYNFSKDYEGFDPFPATIPDADYDNPTFGDFITLEVATALPRLFRDEYERDGRIFDDPVLQQVYLRLLDFDDVRPQSALLDFLLHIPNGPGEDEVWHLLRPVVKTLLDRIYDHEYLRQWLHELHHGMYAFLLKTRFWHANFALDLLKRYASDIGSPKGPGCVTVASHESALPGLRFVVAGHTHEPQVALIGPKNQYYVDTGTWRLRVLYRKHETGPIKAQTYVTVYAASEDRGTPPETKNESFDFWSGYTQRWSA